MVSTADLALSAVMCIAVQIHCTATEHRQLENSIHRHMISTIDVSPSAILHILATICSPKASLRETSDFR